MELPHTETQVKTEVLNATFYLYVYKLLKRRVNGRRIIKDITLREILRRIFNRCVPRFIHYEIIKDLEYYGLIRKLSRLEYEITGGDIHHHLEKSKVSLFS